MVSAGKVTLKFEVDIAELEQKIARSKNAIASLKTQTDQTSTGLQKVGQQSTTTAVQFQTLSQGAINLTTSFAQTYTSLSNLQRAQTTVAAAQISLERAEDLEQRKLVMLNKERQKEIKDLDKIRLLTNEHATSVRDLAVKQQKLSDAQDQANDVNILFGINLLNVGFSALQTGKSMLDMARAAKSTADGVGGVTKSVGVLSKALTFLQAHPVFLIVSGAFLLWEFVLSKVIKEMTGVDASLEGLIKQATGLDKMKSATEILGNEFNSTGQQIQFVSNTMSSAESSMITSVGNVGSSVKQLKADFANVSTGIQELAAAWEGVTGPPSVLDYMKRLNSEISTIVSDINMLTETGVEMEGAKKLILDDILDDNKKISDALWEQVKAGTLTSEEYEKQLDLLDKQVELRKEALRQAEQQILKEKQLAEAIEQTSKKNDKFKFGIDIAERIGFAADGIRKEILNLTGRDIGNVANSISFHDALRVANVEQYLSDVKKHGLGGSAQNVFDYLNRQGDWYAKMQYDNAIRSYADNQIRQNGYGGGRIGTNFFGTGFFKSSGATAAFQVPRGSIAVPAWVRQNIARKNAFGKSEDFLWYNALKGFAGEPTGAMGRTLADKVKRGQVSGPDLSGGLGLLSFFGLDSEIRGMASEALASIDLNDPNAGSQIRSAVKTISNTVRSMTASITAAPSSVGIDFAVGEFTEGYRRAGAYIYSRGKITGRRTQYIPPVLKRAFSPAEIERQIRQDIMWGGFKLTSGFLSNVQLLAEMGSTDFNNTGIISEASTKLNLNENQVFNVRFNPQRGDLELQDRIRWVDRLGTISTGAITL